MRPLLQWVLKQASTLILKKYRPQIIAITGSVGKTSTREAIAATLSAKFRVRASIKSYNDQVGVPMTIIGLPSPGRSLAGWIVVFAQVIELLLTKDPAYPEMLIVEMGADHPGDIAYLVEFCQPHVGVLTAIAPAHMEFFKTIERVAQEKQLIVTSLPKEGTAIINGDDKRAMKIKTKLTTRVLTYGFEEHADISASDVTAMYRDGVVVGQRCKVQYQGSSVPVQIPGALGLQYVYPALAGACVGLYYGMNLVEIGEGLAQYSGVPGRMHVILGIKDTTLIDDTYNSSPLAAYRAVEALAGVEPREGGERFAVLGDMLELGSSTEEEHTALGKRVAQHNIDVLITVGEASKHIAQGAQDAGMDEHRIIKFADPVTAGKFVQEKISKHDVILIKGSQGSRMEKIVKEVMAEPQRAGELLVRQYGKWLTN